MNWTDKKVLVTGAGGFIGSHLCERLVAVGAEVRAFVRYNSRGDEGALAWLLPQVRERIEVVAGDLRDGQAVRRAAHEVDTIFHLGALIAIPYSYLHPYEVVETNVMGSLNVLQAARDEEVRRLVQVSSSEVYGTAQYVPISESHPLQAQSPYSASKIGADMLATSFYCSYDLPVVLARPFNTYGPRQSARAVVPTIITQALTQLEIRLGSMYPTRDLTYVSDIVDGFLRLAMCDEAIGRVVNLGSNLEVSIGDLADRIIAIVGRDVRIAFDPIRIRPSKSEVERLWCDNRQAKELLRWEPQVSLDDGLRYTVDWIAQHLRLFRPGTYVI